MTLLSSSLGMLVVFLAVIGLCYAGYSFFDPSFGQDKAIKKRLRHIHGGKNDQKNKRAAAAMVDITGMRQRGIFDRAFGHFLPNPVKLRARLARTGKSYTIGQYVLWNVVVAIIAAGAIFIFGKQAPLVSLFLGLAIGMWLPNKFVQRLINKRSKQFLGQFPDAIDLTVRGVRSGLPIGESIKSIATEMPAPLRDEFAIVNDAMKLGQPIEKALWEASERLDLPEVKFFVIALSIQRETGGNLAETLENLSSILRKRRFMQLKIKAMSSEARASSMIIGSLPFLMFGILLMMNPKYVMALINDPRGQLLLAVALGMIFLGTFIMRKMASFKI